MDISQRALPIAKIEIATPSDMLRPQLNGVQLHNGTFYASDGMILAAAPSRNGLASITEEYRFWFPMPVWNWLRDTEWSATLTDRSISVRDRHTNLLTTFDASEMDLVKMHQILDDARRHQVYLATVHSAPLDGLLGPLMPSPKKTSPQCHLYLHEGQFSVSVVVDLNRTKLSLELPYDVFYQEEREAYSTEGFVAAFDYRLLKRAAEIFIGRTNSRTAKQAGVRYELYADSRDDTRPFMLKYEDVEIVMMPMAATKKRGDLP